MNLNHNNSLAHRDAIRENKNTEAATDFESIAD